MEGNGRKLAWIAIALSAVALVVSLGGRAQSWHSFNGPAGFSQQYEQQGPMMGPGQGMGRGHGRGQWQQAPQAPQPPQAPQAPNQQQFGRGPQGDMMGRGPHGGMGRMPFFLLPFLLIGKLVKLLFVVGLIWLGFRLIRGRNRPAAPAAYGSTPQRPGPEQPPYPDDTPQE